MNKKEIKTNHRFLDEAGDTSFYGKGKANIIGSKGVSKCFILGMVKFKESLNEVRDQIISIQNEVADNKYYNVVSVRKKKEKTGYYFHATDDLPEVRKLFFDFIKNLNCSFEVVVGRKNIERYETMHKGKEQYFYADLLSHLLKNKIAKEEKLIVNVAARGASTKNINLLLAVEKAKERIAHSRNIKKTEAENKTPLTRQQINVNVAFNVTMPVQEPLLCVADYFCWAVQRVYETGEVRFYDFLSEKISLVVDLYDTSKFEGWKNYYTPKKNPLTEQNKISLPLH
ncbi:MAG: DUF3800 domain-containing protein [Bacteroidota bacterium]